MSRYVFRMPDLGEGTVEAELVEWKVAIGDPVSEEQIIAEVMTDKAAVEVPSPVTGRVVALTGAPGDMIPVGAELIVFETEPEAAATGAIAATAGAMAGAALDTDAAARPAAGAAPLPPPARVMASPATRRKAHTAGIDLATVAGSGPGGRISAEDLETAIAARADVAPPAAAPAQRTGTEEIRVIGLRRAIAERMSEAKRNIPHFAYVEEVDVTELTELRDFLNSRLQPGEPTLSYLPFLVTGLVRVLARYPQCNARYDADRNVIVRHQAVHAGIATQTADGLKVPVLRHAEARTLGGIATEIRRLAAAARDNRATREELTGSTITITSLGRLGGIVTTPVINTPEVAIIGVNKAVERPVVRHGAIVVRRIMNLSSCFDHRFVDGADAAAMIQALKELLEHPATLFMQE